MTEPRSRRELPSGTVTFVFTDIEGSTKHAHALGTQRWRDVLVAHAAVVREAALRHGGIEVRTEGDSFFLAFRSAGQAVAAAADAQRGLAQQAWPHGASVRVRIGMHTGENAVPGDTDSGADYVGYDVHRAARVAAAANGGQVLLSSATRTLVGDQLPQGVTLRDLGEHRMKDLPQPDRLWQLVIDGLPDEPAAPRTLSAAPNNLAPQLTSFVGRRKELAEARALLERSRLLTLVGPGGTGKTRLSIEIASQTMSGFADGVWVARLAPVSDPDLVPSTIANAMGLVVPPGRTPLDHVTDHLRERQALLVLDNFEQVVSAAGDVARILLECPRVKVIVTTRIALRIAGEQEYPVPPLALPDPADLREVAELARAEAVQLFVERARAARPDFGLTEENARAVVGLVAQVDGLPLAIELAAARVKVLPPQAILERLASGLGILQSSARDLPARQQTLRGAIAWSYDLLDDGLRRLFHRLSVFRGGAALEQIEEVCGPAGEVGRDIFDGVAELVDHSLLRRIESGGTARFAMLETIREYAYERLAESGEAAAVEVRHARAYLALAERQASELLGPKQKELLDRLETEQGNLRAALDICSHPGCADAAACSCGPTQHAVDAERVEISLRLASALWRFWQMRGHLAEGRQRTERILALPGAEQHQAAYLGALEAAGGVTYWQGDRDATERIYTRRLAIARTTGDPLALANALYDISFAYLVRSERASEADVVLTEALGLFRAHGTKADVARTLWALSTSHFGHGRWAEAGAMLDEVIATFREVENRFGLGWALHNLGVVRIRERALDSARAVLSEGIEVFRGAGDASGVILFVLDFAELAIAERREDRALRLLGAGNALQERTGSRLGDVLREENRPFALETNALLERVDPARRDALYAEGARLSQDEAIAFALSEADTPPA